MSTVPSNLKEILLEVEKEACTKSFYEFLKSYWSVIVQEEFKDNWHIEYLCTELQSISRYLIKRLPKPYDLVINVPPGSTKTTIVLQMYPAWLWAKDPTIRIISSSHSSSLSIDAAMKSRDILYSSKYKKMFPNVKLRVDKSAKTSYENTRGGTRDVTSTGSAITGRHAHIKLMDDLQEISKAASEPDRKQAIDHMKTLFTREVEKGNSINVLIMQRLHELDCTSYLLTLKNRKVKHICLPAELSDRVTPPELKKFYVDGLLDPLRMSSAVLSDKRAELGVYNYAAQFEQNPTPPEGGIIKRNWFKIMPKELFLNENEPYHMFVDTAYERKKQIGANGEAKNDPSGMLSCIMQRGIVYVWDYREVYMELPQLVEFLPRWAYANGYSNRSIMWVEPKSSGKSTVQTIRQTTNFNIAEITSENFGHKDSKENELFNAAPSIESGRFILIQGPWNDLFLDRVCGFPRAAHDEAVDLICYARKFYFAGSRNDAAEEALRKARKIFG